MSLVTLAAATAGHIRYADLPLSPVAFHAWIFTIRWYGLAYLAGIVVGWWYLIKLIEQPGAPMARRHADDFVFYATRRIRIAHRKQGPDLRAFFMNKVERNFNPSPIR